MIRLAIAYVLLWFLAMFVIIKGAEYAQFPTIDPHPHSMG